MKKQHHTSPLRDVDYWLAEWLKPSTRRDSPKTASAYRRDVEIFLQRVNKTFDQVTVLDLLEYQSMIEGSQRTKARRLASVRSFYRFLTNREVLNVNVNRMEPIKIDRSLDHSEFLTEKEVKALIEAASASNVNHTLIRFLYLTAVRITEALTVRWRDIEQMEDGAEVRIQGKGKRGRIVFVPESLYRDLLNLRGESKDDDLLFPSFTAHSAWRLVKSLARAAKIDKNVSPHAFRHAHLSHALKNGASLVEVRDVAGHASVATTDLYLHADGERATAKRLKVK